jgi:poly(3-hydroxybutyrate) depolymerase
MRIRFVAAAALVLMVGCSGNGKGGNGGGSSTAAPQRGMLLQSPPEQTASIAPADLLTMLGGTATGKLLLQFLYAPTCTITVYHLEYYTADPTGKVTPASGALMVPSGSSSCDGGRPIVVYAHGTSTDRAYNIAELNASDNEEGLLLAAVFAARGYIVVAPNYVGYDISTLSYHPYLDADQQSKDMIDALTAARSALPTAAAPSTTDGGKLFITGYSQGGYVAMATHRAMQSAGMAVTAAAPLSGPYALSAFADAIFEGQVDMDAPTNFTLLSTSYQNVYGNLYSSPSDAFAAPYSSDITTLLPSTTPLSQLEAAGDIPANAVFSNAPPAAGDAAITPATMPANLASVFAAGFGTPFLILNSYRLSYQQDAAQNPDGGFPTVTNGLPPASPANTLRVDLKTNDLRTWAPSAPTLLCAGSSDPVVFYLNTQLIDDYFASSAPAAPVTLLDIDSPATSNDPYATLKADFVIAKDAVAVAAVAGGATDGGASAVLNDYHATLVAPFCLSAAKSFFDSF